MRTKSFQLEETVPGIFLLQGWLGGVLAALVYVVAIAVSDENFRFINILFATAFFEVFATILGVVKATVMWAPYRLLKFQPRAVTRILITSLATGSLALALAYLAGPMSRKDLITWVLT